MQRYYVLVLFMCFLLVVGVLGAPVKAIGDGVVEDVGLRRSNNEVGRVDNNDGGAVPWWSCGSVAPAQEQEVIIVASLAPETVYGEKFLVYLKVLLVAYGDDGLRAVLFSDHKLDVEAERISEVRLDECVSRPGAKVFEIWRGSSMVFEHRSGEIGLDTLRQLVQKHLGVDELEDDDGDTPEWFRNHWKMLTYREAASGQEMSPSSVGLAGCLLVIPGGCTKCMIGKYAEAIREFVAESRRGDCNPAVLFREGSEDALREFVDDDTLMVEYWDPENAAGSLRTRPPEIEPFVCLFDESGDVRTIRDVSTYSSFAE